MGYLMFCFQLKVRSYAFLKQRTMIRLVGFWFSLVWMLLGWLISGVTLGLGIPLSFWMFNQLPCVTTFARI